MASSQFETLLEVKVSLFFVFITSSLSFYVHTIAKKAFALPYVSNFILIIFYSSSILKFITCEGKERLIINKVV